MNEIKWAKCWWTHTNFPSPLFKNIHHLPLTGCLMMLLGLGSLKNSYNWLSQIVSHLLGSKVHLSLGLLFTHSESKELGGVSYKVEKLITWRGWCSKTRALHRLEVAERWADTLMSIFSTGFLKVGEADLYIGSLCMFQFNFKNNSNISLTHNFVVNSISVWLPSLLTAHCYQEWMGIRSCYHSFMAKASGKVIYTSHRAVDSRGNKWIVF